VTLEPPALSRGVVDRVAQLRTDEEWLAQAWSDPETRVVVVADGRALVDSSGDRPRLAPLSPEAAPAGERYLLGVDGLGVAYFAVAAEDGTVGGPAPHVTLAGLREVGALLDDRDAGLFVHAVALANWHATHTHCPRCGGPTAAAAAGHIRRCPADGSEHFPRTDPAVIMAVVGPDDRILLGRAAKWPARRFSTLAGFVEPGESLEQAVRREVREEAQLDVTGVTYLGSQPWPFPSSLMIGFRADAAAGEAVADGEELSEARWFTREELLAAVRDREVLLAPPVSIARRLIEHWYGGPIAEPPWRPA
jgi:NAD+ diphosphatase